MSKVLVDREGLAHELWAAAQLAPGEGISDGVARLVSILAQPSEADGVERYDWTYDEMVESQGGNYVRHGDYDAVTAERDRLRKDAARYQWLRGRLPGSAYRIAGVIYSEGREGVDAAIDAAMATKEGV